MNQAPVSIAHEQVITSCNKTRWSFTEVKKLYPKTKLETLRKKSKNQLGKKLINGDSEESKTLPARRKIKEYLSKSISL